MFAVATIRKEAENATRIAKLNKREKETERERKKKRQNETERKKCKRKKSLGFFSNFVGYLMPKSYL